jgi:GDP-L-fucose synthase
VVSCWGSGSPRREFLHVDDLADAAVFCLEHWQPGADELQFVNVGTGSDVSIAELASLVAESVGYSGTIEWDASKPDGTPRKLMDVTRLKNQGWEPRISLKEGLKLAYQDFLEKGLAVRSK